jgi:hypothetical protein
MHVRKRLKKHEKDSIKCEVCEKFKPEVDFVAKHAGRFRVCKECKTHINRLTRYHITPDDYQALLDKQQNRCAICESELESERNKTVIDHCHDTGLVRGVLCRECNTGLGRFMDKEALLLKAMKYLKKPPATGLVAATKIKEKYQYMREYLKARSCDTSSSK